MDRGKVIAVVGLGLIGGSMAAALRGFEDYTVTGVVRRQETADYAISHGVCDRVTMDPMEILPEADLVYLCMDPRGIVDYMARYRDVHATLLRGCPADLLLRRPGRRDVPVFPKQRCAAGQR